MKYRPVGTAVEVDYEDLSPAPPSDVPSTGFEAYGQPPAQAGSSTPDDDIPFRASVL